MTTVVRARIKLERTDPVRGVVTGVDGVGHEFVGWLAFHSLLEALAEIEEGGRLASPDPGRRARGEISGRFPEA